jgi:hypothetical protein
MGRIILPWSEAPEEFEPEQLEEQTISPDELREMVRKTVDQNRKVKRTYHVQEMLDRVTEAAFIEDDIELAAALLQLQAARAAGCLHLVLEQVTQTMVDLIPQIQLNQACRVCGCTNDRACDGGCEWVQIDLCSRCFDLLA